MNFTTQISTWPRLLRNLITLFVIVVNFGYFSGLNLLEQRSNFSKTGIEEQILGNEDREDAVEYKFKMSESQLSGLIHSHVLSLAPIFFIIGFLLFLTNWPLWFRKSCAYEMLFSLVTTFGGLKLIWMGQDWAIYLVMVSGLLMHIGFFLSSIAIVFQMINPALRSPEQNLN